MSWRLGDDVPFQTGAFWLPIVIFNGVPLPLLPKPKGGQKT